jgi:hypothetical protein
VLTGLTLAFLTFDVAVKFMPCSRGHHSPPFSRSPRPTLRPPYTPPLHNPLAP